MHFCTALTRDNTHASDTKGENEHNFGKIRSIQDVNFVVEDLSVFSGSPVASACDAALEAAGGRLVPQFRLEPPDPSWARDCA